jgi:hypothetical protein
MSKLQPRPFFKALLDQGILTPAESTSFRKLFRGVVFEKDDRKWDKVKIKSDTIELKLDKSKEKAFNKPPDRLVSFILNLFKEQALKMNRADSIPKIEAILKESTQLYKAEQKLLSLGIFTQQDLIDMRTGLSNRIPQLTSKSNASTRNRTPKSDRQTHHAVALVPGKMPLRSLLYNRNEVNPTFKDDERPVDQIVDDVFAIPAGKILPGSIEPRPNREFENIKRFLSQLKVAAQLKMADL